MIREEIVRAWGTILTGRKPTLSIEITRECPLRCPGCYAYEDAHLGGDINLRQLPDNKGDELVRKTLELVDRVKPLHLSIVGGDPLVRYRELEQLLPQLSARGIYVQVVTSAFRPMAAEWASLPKLNISVSVDGLEAEHNERRKPATYERILKNIANQKVTIHCTITGQMMKRPGYLEEFIRFWDARPEAGKIWMSIFTPQKGANAPEILTWEERQRAVAELGRLRERFAKFQMPKMVLAEFVKPPASPDKCVFAQTTLTYSADFKTRITPCQFGGDPDCSQCGCFASMALAAIGNYKLAGFLPVGSIFGASVKAGNLYSGIVNR